MVMVVVVVVLCSFTLMYQNADNLTPKRKKPRRKSSKRRNMPACMQIRKANKSYSWILANGLLRIAGASRPISLGTGCIEGVRDCQGWLRWIVSVVVVVVAERARDSEFPFFL